MGACCCTWLTTKWWGKISVQITDQELQRIRARLERYHNPPLTVEALDNEVWVYRDAPITSSITHAMNQLGYEFVGAGSGLPNYEVYAIFRRTWAGGLA